MMKKTTLLMIPIVFLGVSFALTPLASAQSTGSITVDCTGARYQGVVATGETVELQIRLHSGPDWRDPVVQEDSILIGPGPYDVTIPWVTNPIGWLYRTAIYSYDGQAYSLLDLNEGFLTCPPSGEGCTPGYWKNHLEDWPPTGYSTDDDFDATFGVDLFDPDITLGEAIDAKGGGLKKLARHGTAALLSAAHPDVDYPLTGLEVIALVQAGDVDPLVAFNELGCDIP